MPFAGWGCFAEGWGGFAAGLGCTSCRRWAKGSASFACRGGFGWPRRPAAGWTLREVPAAGRERKVAVDLAALAKAGDDGADHQLLRIRMNPRVERNAGGDDAGPDVRAVLDVDAPIDAEAARLSGAGEVQVRCAAFRRVGVAGVSPRNGGLPTMKSALGRGARRGCLWVVAEDGVAVLDVGQFLQDRFAVFLDAVLVLPLEEADPDDDRG